MLKLTEKRKKKDNKIIVLAKNKLNTIDTLLSRALNDSEISHEEFTNIITERKKKDNKIIVLAKNKLNTIDSLLSSALNDSEISHEEFTNIITETNIYENIKGNIKELTTESSEKEKSTTL